MFTVAMNDMWFDHKLRMSFTSKFNLIGSLRMKTDTRIEIKMGENKVKKVLKLHAQG